LKNELTDLIVDVMTVVMPFKDLVTHILLKPNNDNSGVTGIADSKDGSISIGIASKNPVSELEHGACLGSLPYLNNVLTSTNIKASKDLNVELSYGMTSDKKTTALRSILISDKKKLEIFYQATDPFISKLTKRRVVKITDWPIIFEINTSFIKDYSEAVKIQASAPNMGDRGDIFTLAYADGDISLLFGEKGHQLTLTPDVGVELDTDDSKIKQQALFHKAQFQAVCQLLERIKRNKNGDGDAIAMFNEKALRLEFETNDAVYTITLLAKKLLT